jgi:hypothetical protein
MLSDALRYPANGDGWVRTILVGGLLSILSVLVVPAFFVQGYYVRVLHGVTNDDPEPPRFDGWVGLLVDGLKLLVLNVLVLVALIAVQAFVALGLGTGSFLADTTGATDPSIAAGALGVVGVVVLVGAILLLSYVVPAMFANFARENSLAAAFHASTVLSGALTREYLIAWVLAVTVGLVLGFVASLLSLLIVGIFGLFYVQVVTYYLFGRGFAEGLDVGGTADAVTY